MSFITRLFTGWFSAKEPQVPEKKPSSKAGPKKRSPKTGHGASEKRSGTHKRVKFTQAHRYLVWNTHIGKSLAQGPCWCCGIDVNFQEYEIGHVHSLAEGGTNDVSNLVVLCRVCNRSMGTLDASAFRHQLTGRR
jgi:5-methylcytosine-specific restriction endonuclease McrA